MPSLNKSSASKSAKISKYVSILWACRLECEKRLLRKACEWSEDLLFGLDFDEEDEELIIKNLEEELLSPNYDPKFEHAKACFELNEYDRAAYFVRDYNNPVSRFLHFFSLYKAAEKKRIDLMSEVTSKLPIKALHRFTNLRDSLERSMEKDKPDGWLLYVYGLVLYKFRLYSDTTKILSESVRESPLNWSAWHLLSLVVQDIEQLHKLNLPNHLFKHIFYYWMRGEMSIPVAKPWILTQKKTTLETINTFQDSLFIRTVEGKYLGHNHPNNLAQQGIDIFQRIREEDPYRLDALEIYSNLLYVNEMSRELSKLAYDVQKVDPFTAESNCCIANSYCARSQHDKAITYFIRSLKLNPDHNTSWTLIGHEYLEVKNIDKATQAYRAAIAINKRDCRAWLGLGNAYETIMSDPTLNDKNFGICLYFYSQVRKYRPHDHIMWLTMSTIYEKTNDIEEAIECARMAGPRGEDRYMKLKELEMSSRDTSGSREVTF